MPQEVLNNVAQASGNQGLTQPEPTSSTPHLDAALNKEQGENKAVSPAPSGQAEVKVPEGEQQPAGTDTEKKELEKAAETTGHSMEELSEAWYQNKALPDDAYESLAQAGYPRELVDEICKSVEASNQFKANQQLAEFQNEIAAHVGGREELEKLLKYTDSPNFDPQVRQEIDKLIDVNNPAAAKLAMEKVKSMYEKEFGRDGNPIGGAKSTGAAGDVFKSRSEQSKAFISARNSGDNSLMAQVREKAARTSQHNRKNGVNWL